MNEFTTRTYDLTFYRDLEQFNSILKQLALAYKKMRIILVDKMQYKIIASN